MTEIQTNNANISVNPSNGKLQAENRADIFFEYHDSEIKQNESIIKNALRMIWVGIAIIVIASIAAIIKGNNTVLITGIAGVFVDYYAAIIIQLANKSSDNKQKNLEKLSAFEQEKRIIEFVKETDSSNDFQREMVAKIVERHCSKTK